MDPNLQYWQNNGQSFLSRLRLWCNILDPTLLLSQAEIEEARTLIQNEDKTLGNQKVSKAWLLSLSSVHNDTGATISTAFRPQVFLPICGSLVVGSLVAHTGIKSAMFWQFLLHTYCAGFNLANRNASATKDNKTSVNQSLLIVGAVSYSTITGALPQIIHQRLRITSVVIRTLCKSVLNVPLAAGLAAFNIFVVRSEEAENGVTLFDSNGNAVGVSKEAGFKAIKETAISRATLFGTTAALSPFLMALFERAKFVQRNPRMIIPIGNISTIIIFGLMIPVSFSIYPLLGKIKKENLEKEFQSLDGNEELFYHKGL